ncbi:MAG: hypothetical protein HQM08_10445 [Candidatus Riflebacteria bacterium]|nr:hypothetical protein [Candidatus Riflebacteria bacterium]
MANDDGFGKMIHHFSVIKNRHFFQRMNRNATNLFEMTISLLLFSLGLLFFYRLYAGTINQVRRTEANSIVFQNAVSLLNSIESDLTNCDAKTKLIFSNLIEFGNQEKKLLSILNAGKNEISYLAENSIVTRIQEQKGQKIAPLKFILTGAKSIDLHEIYLENGLNGLKVFSRHFLFDVEIGKQHFSTLISPICLSEIALK